MINNLDKIFDEFDFLQIPIFALDKSFNVVIWNKTLEGYSGINKETILSKSLFDFFPKIENTAFTTRIKDLFRGSPAVVFSALLHKYIIPCKMPNGEYRIQHTVAVLFKSKDLNNEFALFTLKDVTEEANQLKNYKKMRDVALEEIEQRKVSEEKLKESELQLKLLNASKDRFFSIIAHDLKSPFIGLIGFSEMILTEYESFTEEEIKSMMNEIYQISKNTYSLLKNLLDWSRIQTGKIELKIEKLRFSDMVLDIFLLLGLNAKQKNIKLINEIKEDLIVYADEDMLKTVVRNLVSNSIKFTNIGGQVTVGAYYQENKVIIFVKDNGLGMSKNIIDKLFRIDENHTSKGTNAEVGTGLGLLLCDEMIKKHNSQIKVDSQEGLGSRFYFALDFNG